MWGVFYLPKATHIAPCDGDSKIREPHKFEENCPCHPVKDVEPDGRELITHNEIH